MPMEWVRLYADAMPGLQAREALHLATVVAYGGGHMSKQGLEQTRRGWLREAGITRARKVASREQLQALMGGMGITVKHG